MRRLGFALVAALVLACSSSDGGGSKKPSGGISFVPAPVPAGTSVTLRAKEINEQRLVLEVVAHGVQELYGVAFRLKFDPAALKFEKLEPSSVWDGSPSVSLGSVPEGGLLLGSVSRKGKANGIAADGAVVAVLRFEVVQKAASSIQLLANRSILVAPDGKVLPGVSWAGGAIEL